MQQIFTEMVRKSSTVKDVEGNKNGITTLDVAKNVYKKLTHMAQRNAMSTRKYGMDLVHWNVTKYELMERIFPLLNKDHVSKKSIFIVDRRIETSTVEVRLEYASEKSDKKVILKCLHCNKNDCEHVMFSLMLPELGKLEID